MVRGYAIKNLWKYIKVRSLVARRRFELLSWGPRPTFIHKTISDFIDYCRIDERLRPSVIHGYKYIAKRYLLSSNGDLSKDSIRRYL
ncbi:MAG: hypothetical protein V3S97_08670, partial [Candidatus Bathyarchaeia archaeon]